MINCPIIKKLMLQSVEYHEVVFLKKEIGIIHKLIYKSVFMKTVIILMKNS